MPGQDRSQGKSYRKSGPKGSCTGRREAKATRACPTDVLLTLGAYDETGFGVLPVIQALSVRSGVGDLLSMPGAAFLSEPDTVEVPQPQRAPAERVRVTAVRIPSDHASATQDVSLRRRAGFLNSRTRA